MEQKIINRNREASSEEFNRWIDKIFAHVKESRLGKETETEIQKQ